MKVRGSMTVFAALVFMMVASLLFVLLEAARVDVLRAYADMTTELALESVFAEYQPALWEKYHLLCLDGAYGGETYATEYVMGTFGERLGRNLEGKGDGGRMMELKCVGIQPEQYQILTDADGQVFLYCVAEYMKENLPLIAAQTLYERYTQGNALGAESTVEEDIRGAKQALDQLQEEQAKAAEQIGEAVEYRGKRSVLEKNAQTSNPFDKLLECKQKFVLGMVVEEVEALSAREISAADCLENRTLQRGTDMQVPDVGWYERILAMEYMTDFFSDYCNVAKEDSALAYETEYVAFGKMNDRANLEAVVGRLLLAREAANVMHIIFDADKRFTVTEMAVTLAGATVNAAVIRAVECGLIGAWAYAESVMDVRALLCGERVALIKSDKEWTSELMHLPQILEGNMRAKNCESGWSYQDYLKCFLLLLTEKNLAYRMMDIMEQNVRRQELYKNCRMDYMLNAIDCTVSYESAPLFGRFSILSAPDAGGFWYQVRKGFAYY